MARIFIVPDGDQAIIEVQPSPLKDYILRCYAASTPDARAAAHLLPPESCYASSIPVQTIFSVKRTIIDAIDKHRAVRLGYRRTATSGIAEFSFLPEKLDVVTGTHLVVGTVLNTCEAAQLLLTRIESAALEDAS